MRYYLIAGEASGDLHASGLMNSLKAADGSAEFRFFGGDLMSAVGGTLVKHYREMAYMGFIPVMLHLRTILRNMAMCKHDIMDWAPDVVILVDYPGFNLSIAKFVHAKTHIPVYYYISPKIWAWKEYRVKSIKRYVDGMFSILPFEVSFYEGKHGYKIHYVGNPTVDEVAKFMEKYTETREEFCLRNHLDAAKPIIALLAGSRKQEIKDNLSTMIEAAARFDDYQMVLAGAPAISPEYYSKFMSRIDVKVVHNETYALLSHSTATLVTSGTATLEAALFDVPQIVCYETPVPWLIRLAFKYIIKVRYISLVNLIVDKEVVPELFADKFTNENIVARLRDVLPGGDSRGRMLAGYGDVRDKLGYTIAPDNAARMMIGMLSRRET